MRQWPIPAVFMRGGTSKAVMVRAQDLPADRADWDAIFLATLGAPVRRLFEERVPMRHGAMAA